jgi:peptidyl-Lys metalloendopeptidase
MKKRFPCICYFLVAVIMLSCRVGAAADGLVVTLRRDHAETIEEGPVWLTTIMRNESDRPIRFLVWGTPFEGAFNADMFHFDGAAALYKGRLVKRARPNMRDIHTLLPGESISATLDLAQGYAFTQDGQTKVSLVTTLYRVHASASGAGLVVQPEGVSSLPTTVSIHGTSPAARIGNARQPISGTSHCSSEQDGIIHLAVGVASGMAEKAESLLGGNAGEAVMPSYLMWFGAYSPARHGVVTRHFANIASRLPMANVDCTCSLPDPEAYFGYISLSQPSTIHVCGAFWEAPMTGTDSMGGTLVHETSHFPLVAGTLDIAYGQENARALARDAPGLAIHNADNHEYFAEGLSEIGN